MIVGGIDLRVWRLAQPPFLCLTAPPAPAICPFLSIIRLSPNVNTVEFFMLQDKDT